MTIHLRVRGTEQDIDSPLYIVLDMFVDGRQASGQCGIHIEYEKLQEFVDRIDPDFWNDKQYIPGMPIDLQHTRVVR